MLLAKVKIPAYSNIYNIYTDYLLRKLVYLIYVFTIVETVVVLMIVSLCNVKVETKIHSIVQLRFFIDQGKLFAEEKKAVAKFDVPQRKL